MAQNITRLLPDRSIDDHDVINFYSFNAVSGEAGTFVKVVDGNLTNDPVGYADRPDAFLNSLGNATSQYPSVPYKVGAAGVTDSGTVLGLMLKDVREVDENGEKLLFYPEKRRDLQCVLSGEAVPVATAGKVTLNSRAFADGVCPSVNDYAVLAANGQVTGVANDKVTPAQKALTVGKFIGTGLRVSQQSADAFAGPYAVLKFSV